MRDVTIVDILEKYGYTDADEIVFAYMEGKLSNEERACVIHKLNLDFITTYAHVWAQRKFVESLERK